MTRSLPRGRVARRGAPYLAVVVLALSYPVPASAVPRPATDGAVPDAAGSPPARVSLDGRCRTSASSPQAVRAAAPWYRTDQLHSVWHAGRGEGQRVAVIDTGVNPGPRLPRVRGIGDLVAGKGGTDDCDAHGTLVAGIIAGQPDAESGTSGIAPGVEILSFRQSSTVFRQQDRVDEPGRTGSVGTLSTLAKAVRAAADAGATVLNVSEVACVPATTVLADAALGAALRYAAVEKDVVVVAASGNVGQQCPDQNPSGPDPLTPGGDGWGGVATVASPAWYDGLVLAVGAVDRSGAPAPFSLHGPWVDVAAPGVDVVTVGADGAGTASLLVAADGSSTPLEGTSFAAPYVAGLAALVRQSHPGLNAREVIRRIRDTAIPAPGGGDFVVGSGVVDPVAAVRSTTVRPATGPASVALAAPAASPSDGPGAGLIVAAALLVAGALVLGGVSGARSLGLLGSRRDGRGTSAG